MPFGVLLSLLAYALFSCCDAIIKGFGNSLSPYEIAFFATLFSLLPAIFTKPAGEHWRGMFNMRHPWLVNLRALSGMIGNISVIYAFTHIPLAEVYSLAFLAPIFIVIQSTIFLKEQVTWHRWLLLAASFIGVLLVVKPGFQELYWGHFAAVGAAFFGSITTTTLRVIAPHEKRVTLIGVAAGYILLFNGIMMLPTFRVPTWEELAMFAVIGGLGGTGAILFIAATRRAAASQIAPAQYSQIIWAILLGALFYHEFPDAIGFVGLAVVISTGILNVMSDETRIRIMSRLSVGAGVGPATATAEASPPLGEPAKQPSPPSGARTAGD
jgi:drug/metabolite transporter (DMT)-like permease